MKVEKEPLNLRIWTAFSRLIEKRYRRNIGFSPAMSASNLGSDFILSGNGDLIVPLFAKEHFLGAIRVKEGGTLENHEMKAIQEMFQKVGSALLDASASLNKIEAEEGPKASKKQSVNLVGGGFESRHKLATVAHEVLGTWSMVPWTDSGISHWNTDDLDDLAELTLYIRDIFELTPYERTQLLTIIKLPPSLRPHLIVGSCRPLSDYTEELSVEPELASLFADTTLFVDQAPKEYLRLREVLEMLFGVQAGSAQSELTMI
jgi:hypothetical protein